MSKTRAQSALEKLIQSQKDPKSQTEGYFQQKRLAKKERAFEPKKIALEEKRRKEEKEAEVSKYLKRTMRVEDAEKAVHDMISKKNESNKKRKRKEKKINDDDYGVFEDDGLVL
ncbi:uncharacterized protein SOCG_00866 [Schizosaccharomyces octosporus yFS286]|uniref:Uncharacterized protein n=1 Tax=Schizosaccharomyces octosporus (strain yFS286) TaxID=483514 RepID=S9R454_SCHOY|nr:uncharacterized protein SOCG_00866 [Schizosaccharomyces octosporus yFS286]EPX73110.1 hypothetical protein SOCG_00866 [Schizosaccharomyces octosporus yFS286]